MPAGSAEIARFWGNYQDEVDGAALYRALGRLEPDPRIAALYGRLAATEDGHAEFWAAKLAGAGQKLPASPGPGWRTRAVIWLARRFGPAFVLPSVAAMERAAGSKYDSQADSPDSMAAEERSHARVLSALGGVGGDRQAGVHANPIPSVLIAANEGLAANAALIAGLIGAGLPPTTIAAIGAIGVAAGAAAKGLSAWLSVQSARELFERQIETQAAELSASPAAEREELALLYQVKGFDEREARNLAERAMADGATAIGALAREEAGVAAEDVATSPASAVGPAFLLFAAGALVPLLPFVLLRGALAVAASAAVTAAALFAVGGVLTIFTGRTALFSGTRQVAIGIAAAVAAYALGTLVGA